VNQVVIGICPACGQAMKVKEHAPRPHMHYTCHCGWHGAVEVDEAVLNAAQSLRDEGAGHRHKRPPSWWRRIADRFKSLFESK
jgi:hypothetical protein